MDSRLSLIEFELFVCRPLSTHTQMFYSSASVLPIQTAWAMSSTSGYPRSRTSVHGSPSFLSARRRTCEVIRLLSKSFRCQIENR